MPDTNQEGTNQEVAMFENREPKPTEEQKKSRKLLWAGWVVAVVFVAIIVLFAKSKPQEAAALEGALSAGNAEFEAYKNNVEIEIRPEDKNVYDNMVGMFQIDVRAKIHNRGDRPITGMEVVGKMLDMEDKTISTRLSTPIPKLRKEPLKPGESLRVSVKIDAPAKITEGEIKDVTIELKSLKFQ
ncbi:MAG: hypothetical protein ACKVZH_08560 [Blastocatellia bacterium]